MKKLLILSLFFFPTLSLADITMGSGGIADVYVLENGQLDPGTFPLRVIEPISPGYCVNTTGTSGVGEIWDWTAECGAYWVSYGDTITVETETDTGNPTQTAVFYYNCQDPEAENYDPTWTIDTGECTYAPIDPVATSTPEETFYNFSILAINRTMMTFVYNYHFWVYAANTITSNTSRT